MGSPGCFFDAATAFARDKITATEFFHKCLSHLGPPNRLGSLVPLFVAYIGGPRGQDTDAPPSAASRLAQPAADPGPTPSSPLLRQALMATALCNRDYPRAKELLREGPPPPASQSIFSVRGSWWRSSKDIPVDVWTEIIANGYAKPSRRIVTFAVCSRPAEDGIALLEAIRAAGYDITSTEPDYKQNLPAMAIRSSEPAMVQYLWDVFSISGPPDKEAVINAVSFGATGDGAMITWLLDKGLDPNWLKSPPHYNPAGMDPRERAEHDWERKHTRPTNDPVSQTKTALHRASRRGNVEAVKVLLARGASPNVQDGLGQTPRVLAVRKGHEEIVQLLDEHKAIEKDTSRVQ